GEELVGEDGDVGALDARSGQDVYDLGRDHRTADDLLDRQLALLLGHSGARTALNLRGTDRLVASDVSLEFAGLVRGCRPGECVGEDGDDGALDARSGQDVYDLGRDHRTADDLLDRQLALLLGHSGARTALNQRGTDRLEEADFLPDLAGLVRGGRQGEGLGQ